MRTDLRDRIYSRLVECADPACACSGCLLWPGALTTRGYGKISVDGRTEYVHRMTWIIEQGPIPDGLTLDHVKARGCLHRNCAKLAHLEPVTPRENALRTDAPAAVNAAKTHCGKCGTPYDEANTYIGPTDGKRYCRKCSQDRYLAQRDASQGPLGWRTGGQTRSRLTL